MNNTIKFVNSIIKQLESSGIRVIVFGGWAEELAGAIAPRLHKDLDLLYIGSNFSQVDKFMESQPDIVEIKPKCFPHKRAFLYNEIMVELLLLQPHGNQFVTVFWNEFSLVWPEILPISIYTEEQNKVLITPPSIINYYRQLYPEIDVVRHKQLTI
jgi:hypothetical protein